MTNTISYLEAAWTTMLAIGILASLWMTGQSIADLRARRKRGINGMMLRRARNDVRTELIRLVVLVSMTYIAYFALTTPDNPNAEWTWQSIGFAVVLIWIPLALGYDAIRSSMTRKAIMEAFDNGYKPE